MKQKAITLVEMIVVVSIIGILSAISIPTISHYSPGVRLSGSARVLTSNLRKAQEKAITEQNQHAIRFSPGNPPYYQLIRIQGASEDILEKVTLSSDESYSLGGNLTNNQVVFLADGSPSKSGFINLTIGTKFKLIQIGPSGLIKLQ